MKEKHKLQRKSWSDDCTDNGTINKIKNKGNAIIKENKTDKFLKVLKDTFDSNKLTQVVHLFEEQFGQSIPKTIKNATGPVIKDECTTKTQLKEKPTEHNEKRKTEKQNKSKDTKKTTQASDNNKVETPAKKKK